MYKKITHTIVEEHFDHPIASQIKKSMEKSKLVTDEIFSEVAFRTAAHDYFLKYRENIDLLINASTGTDNDLLTIFDDFFKTAWVDDLGNMTKPLYATEFGERINEAMRIIATGIFMSIQSLKMGKDSGLLFNRLQFASNELAQNLNNFNNAWLYQTINVLVTGLLTDILNRVKARIAKDTKLEQQLASKNADSWNEFEKILINGIISQHPERFNKVAMAESFNRNDIM